MAVKVRRRKSARVRSLALATIHRPSTIINASTCAQLAVTDSLPDALRCDLVSHRASTTAWPDPFVGVVAAVRAPGGYFVGCTSLVALATRHAWLTPTTLRHPASRSAVWRGAWYKPTLEEVL